MILFLMNKFYVLVAHLAWFLIKKCLKTFKFVRIWNYFIGNNNPCKVLGSGTIVLKLYDGKVKLLTDVKYVLSLKSHLILFDTLDELSFISITQIEKLHVWKGNDVLLTSIWRNGLYVFNCVLSCF